MLVLSEAVLVLLIEAIRASAIHLSITSTSTVRHGGLSTSTTKSQNESRTEFYIQVPLRNSSSMSADGSLSDWRSAMLAQNSNDS